MQLSLVLKMTINTNNYINSIQFLVPYQRKPKGTSFRFRPSVCLFVRHIKILSCPDFFLRPLIY